MQLQSLAELKQLIPETKSTGELLEQLCVGLAATFGITADVTISVDSDSIESNLFTRGLEKEYRPTPDPLFKCESGTKANWYVLTGKIPTGTGKVLNEFKGTIVSRGYRYIGKSD